MKKLSVVETTMMKMNMWMHMWICVMCMSLHAFISDWFSACEGKHCAA